MLLNICRAALSLPDGHVHTCACCGEPSSRRWQLRHNRRMRSRPSNKLSRGIRQVGKDTYILSALDQGCARRTGRCGQPAIDKPSLVCAAQALKQIAVCAHIHVLLPCRLLAAHGTAAPEVGRAQLYADPPTTAGLATEGAALQSHQTRPLRAATAVEEQRLFEDSPSERIDEDASAAVRNEAEASERDESEREASALQASTSGSAATASEEQHSAQPVPKDQPPQPPEDQQQVQADGQSAKPVQRSKLSVKAITQLVNAGSPQGGAVIKGGPLPYNKWCVSCMRCTDFEVHILALSPCCERTRLHADRDACARHQCGWYKGAIYRTLPCCVAQMTPQLPG